MARLLFLICLVASAHGAVQLGLGPNPVPAAGSVPNSSLATVPQYTLKGNNTSSTATPLDLTVVQVNAMLPLVVGDAGSYTPVVPQTATANSISSPPYTITVSGVSDAWKAFDGANTTATSATLHVDIDLAAGNSRAITKASMILTSGGDDILVQYSDDNSAWTTAGTITYSTSLAEVTFAAQTHRYWRFYASLSDVTVFKYLELWTGALPLAGLVPAPAVNDAAAGKFLFSDGTWKTVAASGTWIDQFPMMLEVPTVKTYQLISYSMVAYTINSIRTQTLSGTCTLAVKINGTAVTGLSAISVTSTPATTSASALNTVAVGDAVTVDISAVSSPVDLAVNLKATR